MYESLQVGVHLDIGIFILNGQWTIIPSIGLPTTYNQNVIKKSHSRGENDV